VVAHNEERNLEVAVRSLLDQRLPPGVGWNTVWIVASGCTDRSVTIAQRLVEEDRRVQLVVEPDRTGKAHALGEVFRRAGGDALVLLNSDARAAPGSVAELVRIAGSHSGPFAVMARPVVAPEAPGRWTGMLHTMWDLHHTFHAELATQGGGSHLSDELLLVSLPTIPPIPDGIINDGSYFAVWLAQHGGRRLYAPAAHVAIEVPSRIRDHLYQRRRIPFGNDQVRTALGADPSTRFSYAYRNPRAGLELVRQTVALRKNGLRQLLVLASAEVAARSMSVWDHVPPRKDHVRWQRIRAPEPHPAPGWKIPEATSRGPGEPSVPALESRVAAIVDVASQFRTGVPLPDLVRLLPHDGPPSVEGAREWVEAHPELARMEGEHVVAPRFTMGALEERRARGQEFHRTAELLFRRPLRATRAWIRCSAITGSAAYGEPEHGDDLDFFVVTKRGALWWFLAYTYLAIRLGDRRVHPREPNPCFNLVLEDQQAADEFARGQGFLFAREALTARAVWGEKYYRGLLASAPWMAAEIPRLYAERTGPPNAVRSEPASLVWRFLNLVIFPWLAAYLQFAGLLRDGRYRRRGRRDDQFRTETRFHRLSFASRRFERLREGYPGPAYADSRLAASSRSTMR